MISVPTIDTKDGELWKKSWSKVIAYTTLEMVSVAGDSAYIYFGMYLGIDGHGPSADGLTLQSHGE